VYNTNENVAGGDGSGIYVWNGSAWTPVKSSAGFSGAVKVLSFNLTPSATSINIYVGGTQTFTAGSFLPAGATYQGVTWNIVSGSDKVKITAQSVTGCTVQGVSAGTATLQVSSIDQNVNKTVTIMVDPVTLKSFALNKSTLKLDVGGKTGTITAQNFIGTNDLVLSGTAVSWSIVGANTTGSTVSPATGNTTTVTSGSTTGSFTVRATAGSITHDCTVTIDDCSSVMDAQGNEYYAGKFGIAGCWMTQNLRSTSGLTANSNVGNAYDQKYYWYPNNNKSTFDSNLTYGLLYTWPTASGLTGGGTDSNGVGVTPGQEDIKGICPTGWHLPNDYEWNQLEEEIAKSATNVYSTTAATTWDAGYSTSTGTDYRGTHGQKMRSTTPVNGQTTNGTSKSRTANGFDALLVGRMYGGLPHNYGTNTYFWSSSSNSSSYTWFRDLNYSNTGVVRVSGYKYNMFSVRCKKNDN
jgi:uncharacterized protein (TIGR02145 family)